MRIKKETILRTLVTALALINSVLLMLKKNPLPFSEEEVYCGVSAVFGAGTTLWSWWKNNSFTTPALMADEYQKELKKSLKKE